MAARCCLICAKGRLHPYYRIGDSMSRASVVCSRSRSRVCSMIPELSPDSQGADEAFRHFSDCNALANAAEKRGQAHCVRGTCAMFRSIPLLADDS
jgi:hypothetical protein